MTGGGFFDVFLNFTFYILHSTFYISARRVRARRGPSAAADYIRLRLYVKKGVPLYREGHAFTETLPQTTSAYEYAVLPR